MLVLLIKSKPRVGISSRPILCLCSHCIRRKHLIVAIGSECYVTLPKGQMIPTQTSDSSGGIPGGGHVLIVPITHYPTFSTIPPDLATPILDETAQYIFSRFKSFQH